jgi:hypothetical protein
MTKTVGVAVFFSSLIACSQAGGSGTGEPSGASGSATGASAGTGSGATGSSGGTGASSSGSGSGAGSSTGSSNAGSSNAGSSPSGSSSGGASTPDSGRSGDASGEGEGGAAGSFACTLVIGNTTTQQWFDGGFLSYPGIDATRFEMFFVGHHYVDAWADPTDPAWSTALDNGHMCAEGATTPDRVIFIVTKAPPYPAESFYQTNTTAIVHDLEMLYPTVKRIEFMTLIRAPNDIPCPGPADAGTADASPVDSSEQIIAPAEDQGIAATAGAFPGLVVALPQMFVAACSDFVSGMPQYTPAGAADIAGVYGKYYADHP